jgi:hypothetical protein
MTIQFAFTSIDARGKLTALAAKATSLLLPFAAFSKKKFRYSFLIPEPVRH